MWSKEKIKEFADDIGFHCQFRWRELRSLHSLLLPDEDCFGMTEGMLKRVHENSHSGYGIALSTDKRFLFYHKALLGTITKEEFPLGSIGSLSCRKGALQASNEMKKRTSLLGCDNKTIHLTSNPL
jgi:hypothetical protein